MKMNDLRETIFISAAWNIYWKETDLKTIICRKLPVTYKDMRAHAFNQLPIM